MTEPDDQAQRGPLQPRSGAAPNRDEPSGYEVDPWQTEPPSLAELALSDVLRKVEQFEGRLDEQPAQVGVRVATPGFRAIAAAIAHKYRISYSKLTRFALQHGLAILDEDAAIISLRRAFGRTAEDAMDRGDPSALTRLDQTGRYEFVRSEALRTTLTSSRELNARLADLAGVCGMPMSCLGVIAVLVSLVTLADQAGYQVLLREEVAEFYAFVARRTQVLTLGDPGKSRRMNGRRRGS
jgi:hypothetical protein